MNRRRGNLKKPNRIKQIKSHIYIYRKNLNVFYILIYFLFQQTRTYTMKK